MVDIDFVFVRYAFVLFEVEYFVESVKENALFLYEKCEDWLQRIFLDKSKAGFMSQQFRKGNYYRQLKWNAVIEHEKQGNGPLD